MPNICFLCQIVGLILGAYQVDNCRRQMLGRCTLRVWSARRRQVAGCSGHSAQCTLRRLELIGDVGESCSSGSLSLLGGQPGKFSKVLVHFQIADKDKIPSYSFLFANKTVTSQMTNTGGQKEGMVSFFN